MAITIMIPSGGPFTMVATVIYALPGRSNRIHVTGAGAIDVSNDGVTFEAVTVDANKDFVTGARFIRSTAGAMISVSDT